MKPTTVDEYLAQFDGEILVVLQEVRQRLRAALPEATEKMSYGMPTYWQRRNLIHFAAQAKHLGIYPGPEAIEAFADQLADYHTSKGTVQFPYTKPIPYDLIVSLAKFHLAAVPCSQDR
jgi:uncharacterized protein YdhG (YjbR/CyaY superfamily)